MSITSLFDDNYTDQISVFQAITFSLLKKPYIIQLEKIFLEGEM
jgi:hypothetical protein